MFGINTYYARKKLEVDIEIEKYRNARMKEIQDLAIQCADQKGEYEHTWHNKMQTLGIEIAKLEAQRETMANDVVTYKKLIEEKDKEIARQHEVNLKLAEQKIAVYR